MKAIKVQTTPSMVTRPTELHTSDVDSKRLILDLHFDSDSGLQRLWIYLPETRPLKEEKLMAGAD
jgi:hypothetical protein